MMEFKEDLGNKRVFVKAKNLDKLTQRSIRHGFFALGKDLRSTVNGRILEKPKHGQTYIIVSRSGRKRRHVASAPGETHANLTGTLRKSMGWQVTGFKSLEFGYGVSTPVPAPDYARALEYGNSRIAPRPSLQNGIREVSRNAEQYFIERFDK